MTDYSSLITDAMRYVDGELLAIHPNSINRLRLQMKMRKRITSDIKSLALLDDEDRHKAVRDMFRNQLREELVQTGKRR